MKNNIIFLTVSLFITLNLCAINSTDNKESTSRKEMIQEQDRSVSKQHKMSDIQFAKKLKELNEYYNISIKKNWERNDPIIDSLLNVDKGSMLPAQKGAYNTFMVIMITNISTWKLDPYNGEYRNIPISKWSDIQKKNALTDLIKELFTAQDELRQHDATPYINIFNSEPLNQFDNLYQLLLTSTLDYWRFQDQFDIKKSLIKELDEETQTTASLQINLFAKQYNHRSSDSTYLVNIEKLITKDIDDNAVVRLIDMRLKYMFDKPNKKERISSSYYEQILSDCNAAIKRFDDSKYLTNIKSLRLDILKKNGTISTPLQVYPNTPFKLSIVQRNYDNLEVIAYRTEEDLFPKITKLIPKGRYRDNDSRTTLTKVIRNIEKLLPPKSDIVFSERIDFDSKLYVEQSRIIEVSGKSIGNYLLVCRNGNNEILSISKFHVSRVAPLYENYNNSLYLYATDFMSGKPIDQIEVDVYNGRGETSDRTHVFTKELTADGFVKVLDKSALKNNDYHMRVIDDKDHYTPIIKGHIWGKKLADSLKVSIFSDRKRYMFGDTVYFRGYLYAPGKKVIPNRKLTYYIKTPNNSIISSLTKVVTTDEWGGFEGKFPIPNTWMTGRYKIYTNNGDGITINVGEYKIYTNDGGYITMNVGENKPPTIEIEMTADRDDYTLGDSVILNGTVNTYAGYPIENATINYVVTRSRSINLGFYSNVIYDKDIVVSKKMSNSKGEFNFSFRLEPQEDKENEDYTYTISAVVSIPTGEMQLYEKKLYVGVNKYILKLNTPYDAVNRDTGANIIVTALDVYKNKKNGMEGNYSVLSEDKEILSGQFVTGTPITIPWQRLKNGDYEFVFKMDKAREVSRDIFTYSASERVVPIDTALFFKVTNSNFSEENPLKFVLGSSEKEIYTLVELYDNQKRWYSKLYVTKNRMEQHTIPYNKEFPDYLKLLYTTFYKGKLYKGSKNVERHIEKQQITLKLKTTREVALPGSQESITITVQDKETGKGVEADILVSIYDKSSDQLKENIYKPLDDGSKVWIEGVNCHSLSTYLSYMNFVTSEKNSDNKMPFEEFEDYIVSASHSIGNNLRNMVAVTDRERNSDGAGIYKAPSFLGRTSPIKVRSNFNQTVLFASGIRTDSMGIAKINYKLPDATATYSIKAFATLKNTTSTVATSEFIVSKK